VEGREGADRRGTTDIWRQKPESLLYRTGTFSHQLLRPGSETTLPNQSHVPDRPLLARDPLGHLAKSQPELVDPDREDERAAITTAIRTATLRARLCHCDSGEGRTST
jgi:hypothetical protein